MKHNRKEILKLGERRTMKEDIYKVKNKLEDICNEYGLEIVDLVWLELRNDIRLKRAEAAYNYCLEINDYEEAEVLKTIIKNLSK